MNKLSRLGKLNLNLGCGANKIEGAINVDVEQSCKPDMVFDFKQPLPFKTNSVDKIFFFHVIEHIEDLHHEQLLLEFHRVLKPGGRVYITYPEFVACAKNYIENFHGQREFWKRTIFGRQLYPSDYHVSLMDSRDVVNLLDRTGFKNILVVEESKEEKFNSLAYGVKSGPKLTYADTLNAVIFEKETHGAN